MGTSDNGQEVLRQNLEEKGTFQALYQMHLLFREKGKRPEGKKILGRLQKEFGQVDLVADVDHSLATFAIADFPVEYKKDKKVIKYLRLQPFPDFFHIRFSQIPMNIGFKRYILIIFLIFL